MDRSYIEGMASASNNANNIFVHETAHISEDVHIGDGTKVWINAQIREQVRIGANCVISKDVYIDHGVTIGDNCKVQNGVSIYSGVTVGDGVFIGPNACFTNDLYPRAENNDWKIHTTIVKKGASIGANATLVCGHTIGEFAMVGAGSVVASDVEPYALVVGNPARAIGRVCRCGARADSGSCSVCGFVIPKTGVISR
jgi:acetyltransferase-like isoleucine patch superfamily enzyme